MTSTSVIAVPSASAWVKIVDAADANICLQNVGSVHVVAVAADSAPDANSTSGFNLLSNSGFTRAHFSSGSIWVRALDGVGAVAVFK